MNSKALTTNSAGYYSFLARSQMPQPDVSRRSFPTSVMRAKIERANRATRSQPVMWPGYLKRWVLLDGIVVTVDTRLEMMSLRNFTRNREELCPNQYLGTTFGIGLVFRFMIGRLAAR